MPMFFAETTTDGSVTAITTLLAESASQSVPGLGSGFRFQAPHSTQPARHQERNPVFQSLPSIMETWIEFWLPGYGLVQL